MIPPDRTAMRGSLSLVCAMVAWAATGASGQASATHDVTAPAQSILRFRDELRLTENQTVKLQGLAALQAAALGKATAAYLRAEADLLEASHRDDLVVRRAALEKRAKVAIDGEVLRLQAEKESRAVLDTSQRAAYQLLADLPTAGARAGRVSLWADLVEPTLLTRSPAAERDSGDVRISVEPVMAEIYLGAVRLGSGRVSVRLPVGQHELKYHAPGCSMQLVTITVQAGPALIVPKQILACAK